jgi:hypothetical protein
MIPATAYSQISELNGSTPTQIPVSTQCLDFNQDGICESIVLANGTIIKNPDLPVTAPLTNRNNTNSTVSQTPVNTASVDENDPCGGGVEYKLDGEIFCSPEEYKEARQIQYEQEQEERERQCEENPICQAIESGETVPWNDPGEGDGDNNNNGNNNPRDDPDCWYGDLYVCDESGECDTDNFDCITDCADGSSVTTGEECPGDDDSDEPADEDLPQEGGCQEEDDYCDRDEDCHLASVDCIDDREFDSDDYDG